MSSIVNTTDYDFSKSLCARMYMTSLEKNIMVEFRLENEHLKINIQKNFITLFEDEDASIRNAMNRLAIFLEEIKL